MKFLRLYEPLFSLLHEDEDIIAVDKPYGFNTHTNDSKVEHSDSIEDGLIEMLEQQRGCKLHIIHRLDQTTTGVIIFGKSPEGAKKYAQYFFDREVKKTYWFVTANKSLKPEIKIDSDIVHKGKELEASTQFQFQKRSKFFELWVAKPYTGRNHQIRIHAKAAGLSLLGDSKYGGKDFAFLCLHNHRIEFPNGLTIESKPPPYFEDLAILEDHILSRVYFEADRRMRIYSSAINSDQAFRLMHTKPGASECDLTIDHFGEKLVLNLSKEFLHDLDRKRFTHVSNSFNRPLLIKLLKTSEWILPATSAGVPQETWTAKERERVYEIRAAGGATSGLPLNQRLHREWVLNHSKGKSVLSLFSQTCGYAVAAALGGASEVISVDSSKSALGWGKKNFELNQLEFERFKFFCRDSWAFIKQALSKNSKFDLIICDVPSFARGEKGTFKIESDLTDLLENMIQCLNRQGTILLATSSEGFTIQDLHTLISATQKKLKSKERELNCIQAAFDFEAPHERTQLKSFLIQF